MGVVDLSLVIAFHPAMRNYDHRAGTFVRAVNLPPPPVGGLDALEDTVLYDRIVDLEYEIDDKIKQINFQASRILEEGESTERLSTDRAKLAELRNKHTEALAELVRKAVAEFSEEEVTDDNEVAESIMQEVLYYIQTTAKEHDALFVFNASSGPFAGRGAVPPPTGRVQLSSAQLLDKWSIRRMEDLRALLETEESIIGIAPSVGESEPCGNYIERITDVDYLETLFFEYYEAREAFVHPFLNIRGRAFLLHGTSAIEELNITRPVIEKLFERYEVKDAVREAALNVLDQLGLHSVK